MILKSPAAGASAVAQSVEPVQASYRPVSERPAPTATVAPSDVAGYPFVSADASTRASVTKADVVTWTSRGLSDEQIIDRLTRSGTVFHLTAADENELRDKGVSKQVIRAMRDMWRR